MTQPIVDQLRFARSEFRRSLLNVTESEGIVRIPPMNSISWMLAHVAEHEQRYWLTMRASIVIVPSLPGLAGYGQPASTPPLNQMWDAWHRVTREVDGYLDELTTVDLTEPYVADGTPLTESVGTRLLCTTYHYWYHTGEAQAVRQLLGHTNLPEFVGDIGVEAPYRREDEATVDD